MNNWKLARCVRSSSYVKNNVICFVLDENHYDLKSYLKIILY